MTAEGQTAVAIPVAPWFYDHFIGDRSVFPAVESVALLACQVDAAYPAIGVTNMEEAHFFRFLEIPEETAELAALVECSSCPDGRVKARLLSRIRLKAMSRLVIHCEIFFRAAAGADEQAPTHLQFAPAPPAECTAVIEAARLYRDLVPFGPSYRTLQQLFLSGHEAWGRVTAPVLPPVAGEACHLLLGSPFSLDGAMHAACVLGQQSVDYVPFPVGFARRTIHRPTVPGATYITRIRQTGCKGEELVFDLAVWDENGCLCESLAGLRMRDVRGVLKKN